MISTNSGQIGQAIKAAKPWDLMSSGKYHEPREKRTSHYRGWTMVEMPRSVYAVKNGTNERRRVCRLNESYGVTLSKFRELVDELEG